MPRPLRGTPRLVTAGLFLAPVLGSLLVCACVHHHSTTTGQTARRDPVEVVLAVTNHNFQDVTVFVEHDGQRTRVGTVTAAASESFVLPMRVFGVSREFQLFAEAVGSSAAVRTQTLTIQAGQFIEWTLEHDLSRSSVGVY